MWKFLLICILVVGCQSPYRYAEDECGVFHDYPEELFGSFFKEVEYFLDWYYQTQGFKVLYIDEKEYWTCQIYKSRSGGHICVGHFVTRKLSNSTPINCPNILKKLDIL